MDRWTAKYDQYDVVNMPDYIQRVFKVFDGKDNVIIIRADSLKFDLFPDNYFDFVYLDNVHTYEHCAVEIPKYWQSVKPGGMIAGDNYEILGVKMAVDEFEDGLKYDQIVNTAPYKKAAVSGVDVMEWWIKK
jgi:hypothetical protein